jgi:hypothetical protein
VTRPAPSVFYGGGDGNQ